MYHKSDFEPNRDEMLHILDKTIGFLNRMEAIPLADADRRIVSEPLTAPYNLPNKPASGMDGIAVRYDDAAAAATGPLNWKEGTEYEYSNTGVAIPDAYDTVIRIENVEKDSDGKISITEKPEKKGENVHPTGSQLRKGEVIIEKGEMLNPAKIGLLTSAGITCVPVYEKPHVIFIPTGDELVTAGGKVPDGANVESNGAMVLAMLKRFGCIPSAMPVIPDEPEAIKEAVKKAVGQADLVIIGAGSSKGSKDYTMDVLEELGQVKVQELRVAPGKHNSLTLVGNIPVMGIPGPPTGAQLICEYYVQAAVQIMMTGKRREPLRIKAVLDTDIKGKWIDFMQSVDLYWNKDILYARPISMQGGTRATGRNAFMQILYCEKARDYSAGESVKIEFPVGTDT